MLANHERWHPMKLSGSQKPPEQTFLVNTDIDTETNIQGTSTES